MLKVKKEVEREELTNPELGLVKCILEMANERNGVDVNKGTTENIAIAALKQDRIAVIEAMAGAIKKANASRPT